MFELNKHSWTDWHLVKSMDPDTVKKAGVNINELEQALYLDLIKAAYRQGLVQKEVQVTRNGKTFTRRQWVRLPNAKTTINKKRATNNESGKRRVPPLAGSIKANTQATAQVDKDKESKAEKISNIRREISRIKGKMRELDPADNPDEYYNLEDKRKELKQELDTLKKDDGVSSDYIKEALSRKPLFRTKEEAVKAFQDLGFKHVGFKGIDLRALNDFYPTLKVLKEKFPNSAKASFQYIGLESNLNKEFADKVDRKYRDFYSTRNLFMDAVFGITLSDKDFTDYTLALKQYTHHVNDGFSVRGNGTFSTMIAHEFGHHISRYIRLEVDRSIFKEFSSMYYKNKDRLEKEISQYSAQNDDEFFSEAFSEYVTNPNPSPLLRSSEENWRLSWQDTAYKKIR